MADKEDLEQKLSEMLTEGDMEPDRRKARELSPKYEIRIQTTLDPIVEETLRYRKIGRELDDRYDRYLERAGHSKTPVSDPVESSSGPEEQR